MTDKYIEAGWQGYLELVVPKDASEVQIAETRQAFFSGASILFETIIKVLDPGPNETEADIQRMTAVGEEIVEFGQALDKKIYGRREH